MAFGFDPSDSWDVYDVPEPVKADADGANAFRNEIIDMSDVIAILFYIWTEPTGVCGDNENPHGVDYDCIKGVDLDGDSVDDVGTSEGMEEGLKFDRSPGSEPNPPWDAGPPDGIIDMGDVVGILAQVFIVDCVRPP